MRKKDAAAALVARAFRPPVDPAGRSIPIYRSLLPTAARLVPYLQAIDDNRWYTNRGELVYQLEQRLCALCGGRKDIVVTAVSGTTAIEGAVLASCGRATSERPLALLPAYTFVATAFAVERCGYQPYFIDIDRQSWMVEPGQLLRHPMLPRTGLVVPVSAYGRPLRQAAWREFMNLTGIAVVIDAAAAFEGVIADPEATIGTVPIAVSFQATKAFSSGEGGAVLWSDVEGLAKVVSALNFGFRQSRLSESSGTNGKMSEYHAAVGLASLDQWDQKAAANRIVSEAYRRAASERGIGRQIVVAPEIASNYALFIAASPRQASEIIEALTDAHIEHRLWYGLGLHKQPYFAAAPADALPVTDSLASCLVALPCFEDLDVAAIERILDCVTHALGAGR